jgi:prepilin-type N-terminal cleavage/methylation domain-containing protein
MCKHKNGGFSLTELLLVLAIIAALAAIMFVRLDAGRDKAYYARAQVEFETIATALESYYWDNQMPQSCAGGAYASVYPCDVDRNVPPGIGQYIAGGTIAYWPGAPWPGSVYDWDNFEDPDDSSKRVYQVSIRFCPQYGTINQCNFPNEWWAEGFDVNSSLYYCVEGNCRPHPVEAADYPGYCANCTIQPYTP